jgi:hypothetical protein
MMNLRSFFDYIKKDKRALLCLILFLLGFALLIIGSLDKGGDEGNTSVGEEEKIKSLCMSVDGVGECRVTLTYEGECVAGIVVLCDGGDRVSVQKRLSDMLVTLYDIGYNRVRIDRLC